MSQLNTTMSDDLWLDSLEGESSCLLLDRDSDDTDSQSYDDDVNDEALDALEASLKKKLELLVLEQRQWDEETDAALAHMESSNVAILNQIEEVNKTIAYEEEDIKELIHGRDQALSDLRGVEQAFSDVYRKYARAKLMLGNAKATEDMMKQKDEHVQLLVASKDEINKNLKLEAQLKLEQTYKEGTRNLMSLECENARFTAVLRRAEMRVETLEFQVQQKRREKTQMSKLADEIIEKNARM